MTYKHLFARALAAAPERLHFAAHSHHLWPDASRDGQEEAWEDGVRLADRKWDKVMGPIWAEAQREIAAELCLPDPATICFAPNTHELAVRLVSALAAETPRILATTGEFHAFRRQAQRWHEAGRIELVEVAPENLLASARRGGFDLVFASHVAFSTGQVLPGLENLAALAAPDGPWIAIDGYHAFMATPVDLSAMAERVFYLGGGYKYAMSGEGAAFIHAPPSFAARPVFTGWYAAFDDLAALPGHVGYAPDGRRFLGSTFDPSGLYRFVHVRRRLAREELTTAKISAHCDALKARFAAAGLLGNYTQIADPQARFLAFKGERAAALHAALMERHVITDVRGDVLRIGFGLYQDADDVDRLIAILRAA
ncbi:class V aminotransferase [Parablastomonas sp. CN1-191]|uniref:kynureninase/PvdN C-terminal domain-containing protein n=1 Tax=Parablastomonas sp. CN1-191 TaxID=3400908 RepID=UPI003BF8A9A2